MYAKMRFIFTSLLVANVIALGFITLYQITDAVQHAFPRHAKRNVFSVNSVLAKQRLMTRYNKDQLEHYLNKMSPSRIKDVVRQFGEAGNNLATVTARRQFVDCTVATLIKQSILSNQNSVVVPQHYSCQKMSFKKTGPTIALTSFPGSGNSWVRELMETTTGIYTGSIYCDKSYIANGMIGEGVQTNNVLVVKTHGSKLQVTKAICLIRNPFDAIAADYSRRKAGQSASKHTSELPPHYFRDNAEWKRKVNELATKWQEHVKYWLRRKDIPVLVVSYERLKQDLYGELKRMLDFTEYNYTEDDIQCTIDNFNGQFHRNHTRHFDPYTAHQKVIMYQQMALVSGLLNKHNISYLDHRKRLT